MENALNGKLHRRSLFALLFGAPVVVAAAQAAKAQPVPMIGGEGRLTEARRRYLEALATIQVAPPQHPLVGSTVVIAGAPCRIIAELDDDARG